APRWSLPVWRASSGTAIHDGHALAALLIMFEIQKAPDKFLSPVAVEYLLDRLGSVYPETVKEARAVRGEALVTDLKEVLRNGGSLANLPRLLDRAAAYPASTMNSEVLASLLVS